MANHLFLCSSPQQQQQQQQQQCRRTTADADATADADNIIGYPLHIANYLDGNSNEDEDEDDGRNNSLAVSKELFPSSADQQHRNSTKNQHGGDDVMDLFDLTLDEACDLILPGRASKQRIIMELNTTSASTSASAALH